MSHKRLSSVARSINKVVTAGDVERMVGITHSAQEPGLPLDLDSSIQEARKEMHRAHATKHSLRVKRHIGTIASLDNVESP